MSVLKMYKWICCLIKCSKWLYYMKKAICFATIVLCAGAVLMSLCGKDSFKGLMQKVKAVK